MALYKEDFVDIELETGNIHRAFLNHTIGSGDILANRFGVRLFRNGEPVNVESAVVSGVFMAPDGTNYAINETSFPGSTWKSGNAAAVSLPGICYAASGQFCLAIKLSGGSVNSTVRIVDGTVCETGEAGAVVPTSTIPTTEEIIAAYEEAVEVIGGSVRFDVSQSLSTSEKAKARGNIDAVSTSELSAADDQLGSYQGSILDKPYEKRIIGLFQTASIDQYSEIWQVSSRAVLKVSDALVKNDTVKIVNPDKYVVGVYYRKKSDNEYVGYAKQGTNSPFFSIEVDTDTYDYYVIVIHYTGGTETNWTNAELDIMNRRVFIYSGDYITRPNSTDANMIRPDIIHTGKYYYQGGMATNANMAYTDLIPIKEKTTYYFPYLTLGYAWYQSDQQTFISGLYTSVEGVTNRDVMIALEAPEGAAYIGVSVRSGDVPNMVLSELPDAKASAEKVSTEPVAKSRIVRETLNWLYNMDFTHSMAGSRIRTGNNVTFDGSKMILSANGAVICDDLITMDRSKLDVIFAIPDDATPSFIIGCNGYYSAPSLSIDRGAIAVWFKNNGTDAEIRCGTGNGGDYNTLLETLDISGLDISSGRKFVISIEKDTVNKYTVSIYDALTPNDVVTGTIEGTQDAQNPSIYSGQIRGWGGPFAMCFSGGDVEIYKVQMYSTSPTYPKVAIWGDSYVENYGRNPRCAYGTLMREALDGDVFMSGRGGATAEQCCRRVAKEINACAPQHIIFNVGVNDSFNVTVATFKTQVSRLIDIAKAKGAEPILVTVPRISDGSLDNKTWVEEVNPWIRASGYRYIDIAYALSTGDGITQDYSKFVGDKTHPNLAGGQAILNYIKAFLPDLLWK